MRTEQKPEPATSIQFSKYHHLTWSPVQCTAEP